MAATSRRYEGRASRATGSGRRRPTAPNRSRSAWLAAALPFTDSCVRAAVPSGRSKCRSRTSALVGPGDDGRADAAFLVGIARRAKEVTDGLSEVRGRDPGFELLPRMRQPLALTCASCGTALPARARSAAIAVRRWLLPLRPLYCRSGRFRRSGGSGGSRRRLSSHGRPPSRPRQGPATEPPARLGSVLRPRRLTPLAESKDPEEVRDLLSGYFDLARAIVARYGGVIERSIGDAVMAVWGAPVAKEDDAERRRQSGPRAHLGRSWAFGKRDAPPTSTPVWA